MHGRAHLLHPNHEASSGVCRVFRSLERRVRARFSRTSKPMDHLGGINPEDHGPPHFNLLPADRKPERDLEHWPKIGTTLEEIEVRIS